MFGLSFGEVVIIAIIALLLLGPDKLPEAAKTLGKGLCEIRRATDELKEQVEHEIYSDVKKPSRPALVPPVPAQPVPGPAGPPPAATAENVPGLDAALAEPPPEGEPVVAGEPVTEPLAEPVAAAEAAPAAPEPRPGPTVTAPIPTVAPPSDPDRKT